MRSGRRTTCQRTKPLPSSSSSSFPPSSFLPWRPQSSAGVGAPGRPHCSSRRPSLVRSQRGCGCCSGTASGTARGPWCGEAVVPGPHRLHRAPRRAAVTQLRSSLPVPPPTSGQPPQGAGRVLRRTPWFRGSAEPTAKCSRSPSRRGAAGGGPQAAVPPSNLRRSSRRSRSVPASSCELRQVVHVGIYCAALFHVQTERTARRHGGLRKGKAAPGLVLHTGTYWQSLQ